MLKWSKILTILFLLSLLIGLNSCAYYNTFYNTKKYFNDAMKTLKNEEETEKVSSNVRNEFNKTVKQASKVLQFYPDSKYVDDSLLMIGQSFFYMHDYHKANRTFNELLENFPTSEFVPQTKLWLAKTQLMLKNYDQAEVKLKVIIEKEKKKNIRNEARYWLAECNYAQEKWAQAGKTYRDGVNQLKDRRLKVKSYLRLGEINGQLGKYESSAEFYQDASETTKDANVQFDAMLQFGKAFKQAKDYDRAARIFLNLIDKFYSHKEVGSAKLELARTYYAKGERENALEWYKVIIEDHPRTEAAVGAYLELGMYEETVRFDYDKAQEHYTKAKTQSSTGEAVIEVGKRLEDLKLLIKYQKQIAQLNAQIASVIANADAADSSAVDSVEFAEEKNEDAEFDRVDSNRPAKSRRSIKKNQKRLTAADLDSLNSVLVDQKVALAELFLFQYEKPDSAFVQYLDILGTETGDAQRALAFFALAYIFDEYDKKITMRDSLYHILAKNYAGTTQGRAAAKRLGLQVNRVEITADMQRFQALEDRLFHEKQAQETLHNLEKFIHDFPDTELQPKAMYSMGWIYETHFKKPEKAYDVYKDLIEKHPNSEYAKNVKRRVKGVEDKQREDEQAKKAAENPEAKAKEADDKKIISPKPNSDDEKLPPPPRDKRRRSKKRTTVPDSDRDI
ncbi:MAG: hypothetical protein DWQ05_12440 [Calditrichaeota bacterium]|nr:MAG: hypothetical protein DWQ05_12440 [Calditrichota bacterium]